MGEKLPLWRLLSGLFVLAGIVVVLLALVPVYLKSLRMQSYLTELARRGGSPAPAEIVAHARVLDLAVEPGNIHITEGRIEVKYALRKNFGLFEIDLHFHSGAASR